jgi:hypothetical protein
MMVVNPLICTKSLASHNRLIEHLAQGRTSMERVDHPVSTP